MVQHSFLKYVKDTCIAKIACYATWPAHTPMHPYWQLEKVMAFGIFMIPEV
jgi:hypothetical protein